LRGSSLAEILLMEHEKCERCGALVMFDRHLPGDPIRCWELYGRSDNGATTYHVLHTPERCTYLRSIARGDG
jgi:hypothetical protein